MSGDNDRVENEGAGEDFMVTLKCDTDKRSLKVNKTVLAKHSKYFEGLVSFSEREITFDSKIVRFDSLKKLVLFMDYGVPYAILAPSHFSYMTDLESLFYAADYLQIDAVLAQLLEVLYDDLAEQMKDVEAISKSHLLMYMRLYRIVRGYEMSNNYEHKEKPVNTSVGGCSAHEKVQKVSIHFAVATHFKRLLNDLLFLEMDVDHVVEILDSDDLRIPDSEVLGAIKRWIYHDLDARKGLISKLLPCVRVDATMTSTLILDELTCHCAMKCSCLTSNEFVITLLAKHLKITVKNLTGPLHKDPRKRIVYYKSN